MKMVLYMLLFAFMMSAGYVNAENFRYVSAEELKKMMDTGKVTVIDARTEEEYRQGHISGALNISPQKLESIAAALPKDKKSVMVFYCRGAG
jgi:rhodanese-related sulfurtransferase